MKDKITPIERIFSIISIASIILLIVALFSSCTPEMGFGKKFENTFLWFNPNNLEEIYVSDNGQFETASKEINGENFWIEWELKGKDYTLKTTYDSGPYHFFHFEGYKGEYYEEMNWYKEGNTFILTSNKLLPPNEYGYYMIALTEDLTK